MATLIPSLQSQLRRMTGGEKRFARTLEAKLEDDYCIWYDLPVQGSAARPDFLALHPRRGLLVLEVKDWKLGTIRSASPKQFTIETERGIVPVENPLEQALRNAYAVVDALKKDPSLVAPRGEHGAGKLRFPWGHGVVLSNITRRQFETERLGNAIADGRVICQDEMFEDVEPEAFQQRLWAMFDRPMRHVLTMPELDRIRFHIYPEMRIGTQMELFTADDEEVPDLVRVMDLQQEQLARSLGEGHRVIHGVAGSGKTMILVYRCVHLAKATAKPILVLCYNRALAARLEALIRDRGLELRVSVRSFHAWCRDQLVAYHVPLPPPAEGSEAASAYAEALVDRVSVGVDRGQIPRAQYGAVLIDEAHDFEPGWLKLATQMVDPETDSLLVLYDDAQSIYGRGRRGKLSFQSVGIKARGRTTVLKLNYRNTAEVLDLAYSFARDVLTPEDADDDGVPLVRPEATARRGKQPELIGLSSLRAEARHIADRLARLHDDGVPWRDMAVLYRSHFVGEVATAELRAAGIPVSVVAGKGRDRGADLSADSVKALTFHSSKGLEFPVVAIPGIGFLPRDEGDLGEEVRLMYVGMTRAMDHLLLTYHRRSPFVCRLEDARKSA